MPFAVGRMPQATARPAPPCARLVHCVVACCASLVRSGFARRPPAGVAPVAHCSRVTTGAPISSHRGELGTESPAHIEGRFGVLTCGCAGRLALRAARFALRAGLRPAPPRLLVDQIGHFGLYRSLQPQAPPKRPPAHRVALAELFKVRCSARRPTVAKRAPRSAHSNAAGAMHNTAWRAKLGAVTPLPRAKCQSRPANP